MASLKYTLYSTVVLLSLSASNGQQNLGDRCFESHVRTYGTCKRYNQCNTAYSASRSNINLDVCTYYNGEPVICCVESLERASNRWGSSSNDNRREQPAPQSSPQKKRLSEEKCEEYTKGVTQTFQVTFLLPEPGVQTLKRPKCDYKNNPLIVGGKETDVGEFPHMAAVGWLVPNENRHVWLCGGSLVSERFVLTAGHCTFHSQYHTPSVVRLGDHDLRDSVKDGANPITVNIIAIIRHPNYKSPKKYDDIALFRLGYTLRFNAYVRPVCLYTNPNFDQDNVIATGWGDTVYKDGKPFSVLRKVPLEILPNEQCESRIQDRHWKNGVSSNQMCAGDLSRKRDTCPGDSGGPVQVESPTNPCVFYIVGITSFGDTCTGNGVYTLVSHYLDWIEQEVWVKDQ